MNNREIYDDTLRQLEEMNQHQDSLDVFINIMIKRSPTIFILINMTLMIWLVQTIFSSKLDEIPSSIYFYAPFLAARPLLDVRIANSMDCPVGYQVVRLKPFPKISSENISGLNLTHWQEPFTKICTLTNDWFPNYTRVCEKTEISCSGFCVDQDASCPITAIKKIHIAQKVPEKYFEFYRTQDGLWKYIYTRNPNNKYITGLTATYERKCANDYPLFQVYKTFEEYWAATKECGAEGTISSKLYHAFDEIQVSDFFINNGIWSNNIDSKVSGEFVAIGYMSALAFPSTLKCQYAQAKARELDNYLVEPTFTESLLVVCFIFFTGCWAWLIGFYCFDGKRKEKNIIVILMAVIELIVIAFTYSQNTKMFHTVSVVNEISQCISDDVESARHWSFGIESPSPFISVMFCCTSFLLLQIISHAISMYMYEDYVQPAHRRTGNFDDNPLQSLPIADERYY